MSEYYDIIKGRGIVNFGHIEMDNSLGGQLVLPRYVFHATLKEYAPALKKKVLDKSWWRKTDRDFGAAVHTTISFDQEKDWAIKAEEKRIGIHRMYYKNTLVS